MRILIEQSDFEMTNLGDVAMTQVAVTRLARLWPHARIGVTTLREDYLEKFCPGTFPVPADGRLRWLGDGTAFGGRLYRSVVPSWMAAPAGKLEARFRHQWPRLAYGGFRLWERVRPLETRNVNAFFEALSSADLVVVSGEHITAPFERDALSLLAELRLANALGARTVLLGQGLGPIHTATLLEKARDILPCVDLIALRERRKGVPLLDEIGVDRGRVMVTGDDAIELAYTANGMSFGSGIGINLRCAFYSAIDHSLVETVRPVLHEAARRHSAPLVPVPVRLQGGTSDIRTIRKLLDGYSDAASGWEGIETPLQLIRQIGGCRIVVTGSYHAAVFALAQGIPAVCLAKSEYYIHKFLGLADMFGGGCELIQLDEPGFPELLSTAIDRAWRMAEQLRPLLLSAAARQIEAGNAAYLRCYELIQAGGRPRRDVRRIDSQRITNAREVNGTRHQGENHQRD